MDSTTPGKWGALGKSVLMLQLRGNGDSIDRARVFFRRSIALSVILVAAALIVAAPAEAEIYRYTDVHGRIHATDNIAAIPGPYRSQVEEGETMRPGTKEQAPEPEVLTRIAPSAQESIEEGPSKRPAWLESMRGAAIARTTARNPEAYVDMLMGYVAPLLVAILISSFAFIAILLDTAQQESWGWAAGILILGVPALFYLGVESEWPLPARWASGISLISPIIVLGFMMPDISRTLSGG